MSARHALAAVVISAIAASPASATVLSASNQAVGTKSSKADYLEVKTVQNDLNATMKEINDAAVANGSVAAPAPNTGEAGFILQKDGDGSNQREPGNPRGFLSPDDGLISGRIGAPAPSGGSHPTTSVDQRGRRGGGGGGGGGGRHGGGAHASPEPSTWMLLGVGLTMIGGYAMMRRRAVIEG